jgi:sortase B
MKKTLLIVVIVILLAVLCFSSWQLIKIWREYRLGEVTYESMEAYVDVPETTAPKKPQKAEEETVETVPEESGILWPEVDFDALREINPDVVGWLYIEGTNISYPVVQGDDNDFYLYRLITGEYNSSGSLFLEAGLPRDFSARNNPVYGHNMKNGSMLAGITGYKRQEFYQEHPVALLLTPERNYQVYIFSAYVLDEDGDAWDTRFTETTMQGWLDERIRRSYIATDVVPTTRDKVLTLSTCTYETDDVRFLVHGILVPEQESLKNAAD